MTGRVAGDFIAEAGKPQKIYTVPNNKVLEGHIGLFNKTGTSTSIEVKRGTGLSAPAATFTFSNAQSLQNGGANLSGQVMFDLGSNIVVTSNNSSPYRPKNFDLTDPLSPVSGITMGTGFPPTQSAWSVAGRLCQVSGNSVRRYQGLVTPWTLGTYGQVEGDTYYSVHEGAVGWGEYAAAISTNRNKIVYSTNVPTSGSVNWAEYDFATDGLADNDASFFANSTYNFGCVANGVMFLFYPSTNGYTYHRCAIANAADVGTTWTNVFGNWYCQNKSKTRIFYANNRYWIFHYYTGNYYDWYSVAESDLFTQTSTPGNHSFSEAPSYALYGVSADSFIESVMQLADGKIVWRSSQGWFVLDPVANTIEEWVSDVGDQTLPANYTNTSEYKLDKVDIGTLYHTVPRPGASDPDNDRIAYTASGIYEFVTDTTWSLDQVSDDAGWIDYEFALNHKSEVEYRGRMFNAGDEIWVRSTQANVTVTIEGIIFNA